MGKFQQNLEVLPLDISAFVREFSKFGDEPWTKGEVICNYQEYLTQNAMFHHYGDFKTKEDWLKWHLNYYLEEKS